MDSYIEKLRIEGLNLIILTKDKTLFTSKKKGMHPIFDAINDLGLAALKNSIVVDSIIGKAAALLVSYFKAKEVHCIILSVRGREVLDKHRIKHYSEKQTLDIKNKLGTDICPFEKKVLDVEDPKEGYHLLSATLASYGLFT